MNIYISSISQLMDMPGVELLPCVRRERIRRYMQLSDKVRCLTAGLMLRAVLGADQIQHVALSSLGKPYLPDGPYFNLSHSGDLVVLAVDNHVVGIDAEWIAPCPKAVAQRVFTPREQVWLRKLNNDEAFYQLWTGKESIMKALGLGVQLPPESFEILPEQAGPSYVMDKPWFLCWQQLRGHMLCCASSVPCAKPNWICLAREDLLR